MLRPFILHYNLQFFLVLQNNLGFLAYSIYSLPSICVFYSFFCPSESLYKLQYKPCWIFFTNYMGPRPIIFLNLLTQFLYSAQFIYNLLILNYCIRYISILKSITLLKIYYQKLIIISWFLHFHLKIKYKIYTIWICKNINELYHSYPKIITIS